ncbi:MAG TPA: hypothetical protein VNQ31_05265 [Sphingomonadaceae bacterium]|nr:hypothetical protein [Sphingomonadaceae bacterium]
MRHTPSSRRPSGVCLVICHAWLLAGAAALIAWGAALLAARALA